MPCRRTKIRRNPVDLFISDSLIGFIANGKVLERRQAAPVIGIHQPDVFFCFTPLR
jgi:hypothetical protein